MTLDKITFNPSYLETSMMNMFSDPMLTSSSTPMFDFTQFMPGTYAGMDSFIPSYSTYPSMGAFNFNFEMPKFDMGMLMDLYNATIQSYKTQMENFLSSFNLGGTTELTSNLAKSNADKISKLTPQMQAKVNDLFAYAESQGMKVTITSGYRTQAEQQRLLKTRPRYAAKNSLHCQGKAIDINIANGTDADYKKLGDYAKSIGMRWGGDFSKVRERWHFDLGLA